MGWRERGSTKEISSCQYCLHPYVMYLFLLSESMENLMQPIDAAFDTCASCYIFRHDVLASGVTIRSCEKKPLLVDASG
jgi:hypothetical protein